MIMATDFDVIIIGSGPAGVSAAWPLVQNGLRVIMIDGGKVPLIKPPIDEYISSRTTDSQQWKWMIGEDFHALKNLSNVSPKIRTPTLKYVFEDFESVNSIKSKDFLTYGSLAAGGLSNAWGCGVASLSENELSEFPFKFSDIEKSYEIVSKRIGVSGRQKDDLSNYFGLDKWIQPPIQMDTLHDHLYKKYLQHRQKRGPKNFRMGRSRVAVLSEDLNSRKSCDNSGTCLWGCNNKAMYSAANEIEQLKQYQNFTHKSGFIVDNLKSMNGHWVVEGNELLNDRYFSISANRIFLAAGTLATTRLVLKLLKYKKPVSLLSSPTAAFLIWLPRLLGTKRVPTFGLGQLSFASTLENGVSFFGSTFNTNGIPVSEFSRHMPFQQRFSIDVLKYLLSSCLVGNAFLPGNMSLSTVQLNNDDKLEINGGYSEKVPILMSEIASQIRKEYWHLGALLLPQSFTIGSPGGDIHYSGTLPMRESVNRETHTNDLGELNGLCGVHVVDGACLSTLSEKSHTLTIMANADRISRKIVNNHAATTE